MMRILNVLARHVSTRDLVDHVQGDSVLPPRLLDHLAHCARCRAELSSLRQLFESARDLSGPVPSSSLLERIHARIDAGDVVLVPTSVETGESARARASANTGRLRGVSRAAAAIAAVLVVTWIVRPASDVMAGDINGDLTFVPASPRAGDSVQVAFRAPQSLAGERRLVLRGRFRDEWSAAYNDGTRQQSVATLERGRDGVFRGAFRLPAAATFGAFAVEDTGARRVDNNGRRLWELLISDSTGQPLPEALKQREYDLMGRNATLAFETARQRVARSPEDPDAWSALFFHQKINLGKDADTALASHQARLVQLHRLWSSRTNVPFRIVYGLLLYAAQITESGDSIRVMVRNHWRPVHLRVAAEDQTERAAVEARWFAINDIALRADERKDADSLRIAMNLAEHFWSAGGSRDPRAVKLGEQIARIAGDTGAARMRWTDRYAAQRPALAEYAYRLAAEAPALRPVVVQRYAALVQRLTTRDDTRRPLELTVAEALREDSAHARRVLGFMAEAQLAAGDTVAATGTLKRAVAAGWSRDLIERAATVLWRTGDRASAVPIMAQLAVDPGTRAGAVDSLSALARTVAPESLWTRLLVESRGRMRSHFLGAATMKTLPATVSLSDARGETTLSAIAGGRPAVVVFWSEHCGPSRGQMLTADSLSRELAAQGAVLIPITEDPLSSPEVTAFLKEAKVTIPVYSDRSGVARRALGQWATPEFFVLDATGALRFPSSRMELLPAQVAALRTERSGAR